MGYLRVCNLFKNDSKASLCQLYFVLIYRGFYVFSWDPLGINQLLYRSLYGHVVSINEMPASDAVWCAY